ncbi:hypothetical protein DPMN_005308 [Dreissena polymorpha]|uniref:Uncharacterized protein n=1 Tax=Dreissena polymorpha TaxID=45954 RepID=A0A9D4MUC4_DREPO|nr:hypothetical protein DPMN_005308 [Dreissena polymorpha]
MSHAVKSFFLSVVEELTSVLQVFFNHISAVEDLFRCTLPSSESSMLFRQQFPGIAFKSIKDGIWVQNQRGMRGITHGLDRMKSHRLELYFCKYLKSLKYILTIL